jgi:hypothetical protein
MSQYSEIDVRKLKTFLRGLSDTGLTAKTAVKFCENRQDIAVGSSAGCYADLSAGSATSLAAQLQDEVTRNHTQGAVWYTEADELEFHQGFSRLPVYCINQMERHQSQPQLSRNRCGLYRSLLEGMLKAGIKASWDGNPQSPIFVSRQR